MSVVAQAYEKGRFPEELCADRDPLDSTPPTSHGFNYIRVGNIF